MLISYSSPSLFWKNFLAAFDTGTRPSIRRATILGMMMIVADNVTEIVKADTILCFVRTDSKMPMTNVVTEVSPKAPNFSFKYFKLISILFKPGIFSTILQTTQLISHI